MGGRSTLSIGKKILLTQTAFVYMGKPAIFKRIIGKYTDLKILLEYARSGAILALPAGNGATRQNMTTSQNNYDLPSHEYVRTGKISAEEYEAIHQLSMVICSEHDYVSISVMDATQGDKVPTLQQDAFYDVDLI